MAWECLALFRSRDPPKNAYMCRALLVRAGLEFRKAQLLGLKGAKHDAQVLVALEALKTALAIAVSLPSYHFLGEPQTPPSFSTRLSFRFSTPSF